MKNINKVNINGETYNIQDKASGYLLPKDIENLASKEYVEKEIATFDFVKIVQELPDEGLVNRTYLVVKQNSSENDLYDEYIWINKGTEEEPSYDWEFLGIKKIEVDLTDYAKKNEIPDVSNFITKDVSNLTNYYNKTDIDNMIGDIESLLSEV